MLNWENEYSDNIDRKGRKIPYGFCAKGIDKTYEIYGYDGVHNVLYMYGNTGVAPGNRTISKRINTLKLIAQLLEDDR